MCLAYLKPFFLYNSLHLYDNQGYVTYERKVSVIYVLKLWKKLLEGAAAPHSRGVH